MITHFNMKRLFIYVILTVVFCPAFMDARRLEKYNVDKSKISVSGLSSGGAMTVQFHIAFSSSIMGAAPFAGHPFGCGDILENCSADSIVNHIRNFSSQGHIDDPANLKNHNVYIFHGVNDILVEMESAQTIRDTYTKLQAKTVGTNLTSICGHGMPTLNYGVPCDDTDFPAINKCNWQGAFHSTNFIYGDLAMPGEEQPLTGEAYEYEQAEFTSGISNHSMDDSGYIYVPSRCKDSTKQCRLHVVFHGCTQGKENLGLEYANSTGYNEVGEVNDIIMLYPQAISQLDEAVINPLGCWDAFGFTTDKFMFKSAPQMRIVKAQIDRITG